jgi:hypothetical protein
MRTMNVRRHGPESSIDIRGKVSEAVVQGLTAIHKRANYACETVGFKYDPDDCFDSIPLNRVSLLGTPYVNGVIHGYSDNDYMDWQTRFILNVQVWYNKEKRVRQHPSIMSFEKQYLYGKPISRFFTLEVYPPDTQFAKLNDRLLDADLVRATLVARVLHVDLKQGVPYLLSQQRDAP